MRRCIMLGSSLYAKSKFEKALEHIPFDIDEWYHHIAPLTFATTFIPLPPPVARAMVLFYRYRYCHTNIDIVDLSVVRHLRDLRATLDMHISCCIRHWYDGDDNSQDKGVRSS